MMHSRRSGGAALWAAYVLTLIALCAPAWADGKMVGPATFKGVPYKGSPEERSQEAILIFREGSADTSAKEDLILRVTVEGKVDRFAWVIPFPAPPKIAKEDAKLFRELYDYVQARLARRAPKKDGKHKMATPAADGRVEPVEVLSRKTVGSYDTAVVRENVAGALNQWLVGEGFQSLGDDAEDVIGFYRTKKYVFACIKVDDAALGKGSGVDLHPLRFTFATGGRDGIYFPMKMTGLQTQRFDVNLYVFYAAWLNDHINRYGYEHRGFRLRHRDWDTADCTPNAGKTWSTPRRDPYLSAQAHRIPAVTALFQKLHPGARFYLTNIRARALKPGDVREWRDDLWLFPYYRDPDVVPDDARPGAVASAAWHDTPASAGLISIAHGELADRAEREARERDQAQAGTAAKQAGSPAPPHAPAERTQPDANDTLVTGLIAGGAVLVLLVGVLLAGVLRKHTGPTS